MAVYVWSKEDAIKKEVLSAYKDAYFNEQRLSKQTAIALILHVKQCSEAEANSFAKLIELIGIPAEAKKEIWKFARSAEEEASDVMRACALKLICYLAKVSVTNSNFLY